MRARLPFISSHDQQFGSEIRCAGIMASMWILPQVLSCSDFHALLRIWDLDQPCDSCSEGGGPTKHRVQLTNSHEMRTNLGHQSSCLTRVPRQLIKSLKDDACPCFKPTWRGHVILGTFGHLEADQSRDNAGKWEKSRYESIHVASSTYSHTIGHPGFS